MKEMNKLNNCIELTDEEAKKIASGSVTFVVDNNAPGPYAPNLYENQTNKEFENPYKK